MRYTGVSFCCRGLIIKNVTLDDSGSYKCKATQSGYGITDFRDLVIHLKIERELSIVIYRFIRDSLNTPAGLKN